MKDRTATRWYWMAALGITIPGLLYSAELTNPPPPKVSVEKPPQAEIAKPVPTPPPATPSGTKVVYKPPLRGAPAVRIDGGSRGSGISLVCLTVLTPNDTALTVQAQPSLFWYQSQPEDVPVELTILAHNVAHPLLEVHLPNARNAGIQRLNLSDHNVKLVPGVEYEWVVALVVDPENRSKDVVASGWIERVDPPPSLQSRLAHAGSEDLPAIYAEEGIWLDTMTAMASLIDARPNDRSLQQDRAALLQQVGLTNAAAYAAAPINRE
ncbi:MAG TPA: DUF928 domain-containing protein [Verrucomicrobiae bacterium]|nr:DUF928 domain-containing protein [Verrucomicrobiae bacterium]